MKQQLPVVSGKGKSLGSLDNKIRKLNEILVNSATSTMPMKAKSTKKPKLKVWNPEIKQAIVEKKKAFWNWKKGRC